MKPNEIAELPPIRRNTPSEMREVIDAIEAGKPIQYKCVDDGETVAWRDTIVIAPNFHFNVYRVKPEEPKKRWRPFKNVQEFVDAAGGLGAIWIRGKNDKFASQVTCIDYSECSVDKIWIDSRWLSFKILFEQYIFADERPCGVEEDVW